MGIIRQYCARAGRVVTAMYRGAGPDSRRRFTSLFLVGDRGLRVLPNVLVLCIPPPSDIVKKLVAPLISVHAGAFLFCVPYRHCPQYGCIQRTRPWPCFCRPPPLTVLILILLMRIWPIGAFVLNGAQ